MRRYRHRRISKKFRFFIFLLYLLLIILIGYLIASSRIKPIIFVMAEKSAKMATTKIINDAVYEKIAVSGITYDNLVSIDKDNNGKISAIKTDIIKINGMKSQISLFIIDKILEMNELKIKIPLGNIFSDAFTSGRGPNITVKINPIGSITTDFENKFLEAGINQTRHQMMLNITTDIDILILNKKISTKVSTSVCISETIVVGDVPDAYTKINRLEDDMDEKDIDDIYDFGASPSSN